VEKSVAVKRRDAREEVVLEKMK